MHSAPRVCPVCQDELVISHLHCDNCETTVSGTFGFNGLFQLDEKQLSFIETFIRCEGKFNRMEKEMGVSYPTVRIRLREIIEALGYAVGDESIKEISEEERSKILDQIAGGELTAEEAMQLLEG